MQRLDLVQKIILGLMATMVSIGQHEDMHAAVD